MSALNYVAPSLDDTASAAASSQNIRSAHGRHSDLTPMRWSAFVGGLVLVVFFMLGVEVAVCSLVGAASHLAGGLYHRVVAGYEEFERPTVEELSNPVPQNNSSVKPQAAPAVQQHLARHHAALNCMQGPHNCN